MDFSPNCMNSANDVAKIQFKLLNEIILSHWKPCACQNATFVQSFHKDVLSIHWYIAQNLWPTFFVPVLFRHSSNTAKFSRFLKAAIATPNFMNEIYNRGIFDRVNRLNGKRNHCTNLRLCIRNLEIKSKTSENI